MTHDDMATTLSDLAATIRGRMESRFPESSEFLVIVTFTASSKPGWGNRSLRAAVYNDRMVLVDRHDSCGVDGTLDDIADKAVDAATEKMQAAMAKVQSLLEGATA